MSTCPYTWVRNLFGSGKSNGVIAKHLRVSVIKNKVTVVDVALPANSARWLIDLIPQDVLTKIRSEGIPIEEIQDDLAKREVLNKTQIFSLVEPERTVQVWLD